VSPATLARRREARRLWGASEAGRAYLADWRRRHRDQENARKAKLRALPGWRAAHEPERHQPLDTTPLPLLMPELQHGNAIAFWEDELRLDLAQERELARLEGRDPAAAIAAYRSRELNWRGHTAPLELVAA
jgi:hypothetical protein